MDAGCWWTQIRPSQDGEIVATGDDSDAAVLSDIFGRDVEPRPAGAKKYKLDVRPVVDGHNFFGNGAQVAGRQKVVVET